MRGLPSRPVAARVTAGEGGRKHLGSDSRRLQHVDELPPPGVRARARARCVCVCMCLCVCVCVCVCVFVCVCVYCARVRLD